MLTSLIFGNILVSCYDKLVSFKLTSFFFFGGGGIICIVLFLSSIILVRGLAKASITGFGRICGFVLGKNCGFEGSCSFIKLLLEGPTGGVANNHLYEELKAEYLVKLVEIIPCFF